MGIRFNTRLGKNTSASVPASWLLVGALLVLGAVIAVVRGLVGGAIEHPWRMALTWAGVVVVGVLTYKAASWLYRRVSR